jgi:hypothetical protein
MSFLPPVTPPTPLDSELAHARQQELEEKAARYAQLHPDDGLGETSAGIIRRTLSRIRAALSGHR